MVPLVEWIVANQRPLLVGLIVLGGWFVYRLVTAQTRLEAAIFGIERRQYQRARNVALLALLSAVSLAYFVYMADRSILPQMTAPTPTLAVTVPIIPTSTPILAERVVVDSSGCANPQATLTAPQTGDRITGSYEVQGTADIENFGFYQIEISGARTHGAWIPVDADNRPIRAGALGRFDASAYESGEYALRLVVFDNMGNFPRPCVIAVTLLNPNTP
jgi:hypothetical protein